MNVERRLHHAGRELREVPIEVPPLGSILAGAAPRRRSSSVLQALAAPMLFVAGGLFAYGAVQSDTVPTMQSDVPASVTDVGAPSGAAEATRSGTDASPGMPWSAGATVRPADRPVSAGEDAASDRLASPSARAEQEIIAELLDAAERWARTGSGPPVTRAATARIIVAV